MYCDTGSVSPPVIMELVLNAAPVSQPNKLQGCVDQLLQRDPVQEGGTAEWKRSGSSSVSAEC